MNFVESKKKLKDMVDQFRYNLKDYKSGNFNETNTRQQFIDKFFELLGWDVNNKFGYSEQYKEVVLEDRLKIEGNTKAPDYSFRLGGRKIFFVEAKKPSVNIKDEIEPAYQIRRYSWTAKLPIGILTDFEELAIYDTRIKPNAKDKAGYARIKYLNFEEYEENREWIYNTLSKEAVMKGALDKYVQEGKKKGTQSVDTDFLNMIDDRREALAKNIYLRYGAERDWDLNRLNSIVGNIVDKIIFLRIAEDKKIENSGTLEKIGQGKEIWKNLIKYFADSDKKYGSGLFDNVEVFKRFELDDKILKKILLSLYYPVCPYEFSVLGVDILGNIYEKFLGKTIVKHGRTITTEFKPEVKKAGGVFYTPQYIVDYIVKNTVGELLKNKTPKQALELDIVDPACGSGAFLIGTYNYILERFLQKHTKDETTIKKTTKEGKIYQFKDGYHLSFAHKKEILKNMIYGVDIDRQAVAVSKLSLLLKLLEGETAETANQLFSTIDAKLLPNLDDNIKCGNSLVDSSIYENLENPDEETIKKINAFDWEKEFPHIIKKDFVSNVFVDRNVNQTRIRQLQDDYGFETYAFPIDRYVGTKINIEKGKEYKLNVGGLNYQDSKYSSFVTEVLPIISYKGGTIKNIDNWGYCNNIFSIGVNEQEINMFSGGGFSCGQMVDEGINDKFKEIQDKLLNIIGGKNVANNHIYDFMIMLNFLIQNSGWHSGQKISKNEINSSNTISKCKYFISNEKTKGIFKFREEIGKEFGVKILTDEGFKEELEKIGKSGFDAVIGNPPYIKEYTNKEIFDYIKLSELSKYYQGKMDFRYLFACKGLDILKKGGLQSFIAPNNWISNAGASKMRGKITQESKIKTFVDFVDFMIFQNASIQTMVYVLENKKPEKKYSLEYMKILDGKITDIELSSILNNAQIENIKDKVSKQKVSLSIDEYKNGEQISFVGSGIAKIIEKIKEKGDFRLEGKEVAQGIVGAPDKEYLINDVDYLNKEEKKFVKKFYTNVGRYNKGDSKNYIIYLHKDNFGERNIKDLPNIYSFFEPKKKELQEARIKLKTPSKPYYFLHRERDQKFFDPGDKIVCGTRVIIPSFCFTEEEYYGSRALNFIKTDRINLKYLTGILNSKLVVFWLQNKGKLLGKMLQIDKGPLLEIPIVYDESKKDKLIELVDQMLFAQKKLRQVEFEDDKKVIAKQIEIIDDKIDNLVFDLYGLSEEERRVILNG
ncbi:MAG TPA: N-6 DNA methylase [Candidatus Absconditabacterales bacterium]|nr:N-6 DNA methylase [Candidatus Absconditabacterales bacterium]